ncbi:acyl carrier protein [Roseateles amylovorans]|uniref:Phosphopantetheine-binding protein n=1 Tax=Roseateles amylovorans TaxID=2978473 RepID=A0ABY6ATC5_9BURK|nr:phosphopantetheine-binding protein [Roseateles amylovorans]UXH76087.1 phosphopantetheine-binding protein [Roseateles amylovorans]
MIESVERELRDIYVKALRLRSRPEDLPRADLIAALAIDSIAAMEILVHIETAFSIEFPAESLNARTIDSFDSAARCIVAAQSTAEPHPEP